MSTEQKRELYQQGDVLLVRMQTPPDRLISVNSENGSYVLVTGEHTGHAHTVAARGVAVFVTAEGKRLLHALETIELRHNTHKPQIIAPGWYEIDQVQEVDPFTAAVASVHD